MPEPDPPHLTEVAFQLKRASRNSIHEKNVRHGHITTPHVWPATCPYSTVNCVDSADTICWPSEHASVGHPYVYEPDAPASGSLLFPIPYGFAPFPSFNLHPFPILSVNNINNNRVEILFRVDPATTPTLRPEPRPRRRMLFQCEEIGQGLTGVKSGVNRHLSNRFCWGSGRFGGCFGEFGDSLGGTHSLARRARMGFRVLALRGRAFGPFLGVRRGVAGFLA